MQNYTKSFHRKSKNGKISICAVRLLNVFILKRAFFTVVYICFYFLRIKNPTSQKTDGNR